MTDWEKLRHRSHTVSVWHMSFRGSFGRPLRTISFDNSAAKPEKVQGSDLVSQPRGERRKYDTRNGKKKGCDRNLFEYKGRELPSMVS